MNYPVEFIPNTSDDQRCSQAAYLMIVKFFEPDFEMDWNEWSRITGFENDKGTWASAALLWLKDHGFDVTHVSLFDYKAFVNDGGAYLEREFGVEVASWQIAHSNIPLEQERAKRLLAKEVLEMREPTQEDIKRYLNDSYLVRCLVNSRLLNGKSGYIGHSIVVSGYDSEGFIIQDPGLPPLKNRKVPYDEFEKAWAAPNKEAKELDAIKVAPDVTESAGRSRHS